ncbi:MAG: hypothetical protein A3K68_00815 [Euryarchaeota archaeon RBG_16_68_13]|nr:MAG: hypothetical protein A3K68_00815 [Euryarchaeota archaeon RBG_16_68_13]
MKRIVILGGGVGGVIAARELSRRLRGRSEITLIDKEARHHFPPSYPWLAMGWREPAQLWRPLSDLRAPGVKIRQETVLAIDPKARAVTTSEGSLAYDFLLMALGAELQPSAIEGLGAIAHHTYDLESAVRLRDALREFRGGRVLVGVSRLPFKCPAAPYEMALLMDHEFRRRGIRDRVDFSFFTPEPHPVPAAGAAIGKEVEGLLVARGIEFHAKREIDHVEPEGRTVHFKAGAAETFDLLVAVPPHSTSAAVRTSDLAKDGPWVPVDPYTMRTAYDDIYAVGDVTKIPTPAGHVPFLPKAGVFAHGQATVAARNIAAAILGETGARWDGHGVCFLEVGGGKAGMVRGNFYGGEGPAVRMRGPGRISHLGKVMLERRWLRRHFR